jgi:hypothetical protein
MHRFRVFVSHSHEDYGLAKKMVTALRRMRLEPLWDEHIQPGRPFSDEIKGLIAHSHIFLPLITEHSIGRPWVHQETGYAMALNIPVLPVAIGRLPGEMIAHLEAVRVKKDLSDLRSQIKQIDLEQVVFPSPSRSEAMVSVEDWPEDRARAIADAAEHVARLGSFGRVRHRGALSSFCIPDRDVKSQVWKCREGKMRRSDYYRQLQREERQALELHARKAGCSLIVDVAFRYKTQGPRATRARLATVLGFLESMPDERVQVALTPRARKGNVIIVGDWFVAESRVPRAGIGYEQTVFNWHAPTVLRWARQFDQEFSEFREAVGVPREKTRRFAISQIRKELDKLRPCDACREGCCPPAESRGSKRARRRRRR